jgi:hypothetical protein
MKDSSRLTLAQTFGLAAHELGRPSIPALDSNLMAMLEGQRPGEGDGMALMRAWRAGWTQANLSKQED